MGVADLIDSGNVIDKFDPVTRDESGLMEVTGLGIRNALDNFHTFSAGRLKGNELDEQQRMIEERTGSGLYDLIGEDARGDDVKRFERVDALLSERKDDFLGVPNSVEVIERAREKSRLSTQDFQEAIANTSGFKGVTGGLVGSFAGAIVDPVNLALLPLGAGAGKTVLQTVMIEAGINAGAEALTQPTIAAWQREIGNEYGFTDALANVGFAAVLGGGFAGVVKGAKPTASAAFEYISKSEKIPAGIRNQIKQLADYAHIKERNPYEDVTGIGHEKHVDNILNTERAFEARKTIDDVEIDTQGIKKAYKGDGETPTTRGTQPIRMDDPHTAVLADTNKFSKANSRDVLDDAEVERVRQAEATEIKRIADNEPDFDIKLDTDELRALFPNKERITARDVLELREADDRLVEAIRVCAVG